MIGLAHSAPSRDSAAVWTAPATVVVGAGGMTHAERDAVIADRWFRARPHVQAQVVSRSGVRRVGGPEDGELLGRIVRSLRDFASAGAAEATNVWEVDQRSGLIRHTELIEIATPSSGSAAQAPRVDAVSLRERDLAGWEWESAGLIDPIAALLAPEVTDAVACPTLAPASGATATRTRDSARRLTWSGQGESFAGSRRSAVVEGIERLVGGQQFTPRHPLRSARSLEGRVLTPRAFDPYLDAAYGHLVERFDAETPHEWVPGSSLRDDAHVWIPRELVYYAEIPENGRWALGTSSGCATGSSLDEATVFGLLELIERDTFVNAWYGGIDAVPALTEGFPGAAGMLARVRLLGWRMELGLLRNAWNIPVFVAAVDTGEVRAFGAAAHLDVATAGLRAMTEAVAYAPGRILEVADNAHRVDELRRDPRRARHIEDHPLLPVRGAHPAYATMCGDPREALPLDEISSFADAGTRLFREGDSRAGVDIRGIRSALVRLLADEGIETFRVVQSAPFEKQLGLETVMTLAPALSQLDFGWEAQRVRTSTRPLDQARLLTGRRPSALRDLPHPFS
ncbi:MAG: hypothetical protein K0R81_633 [Microbacterium sp.]|jgi:ribosomal protein S12 methylthiotransferase accessory factor|nr:hypothetical protein [Microbacterium sp.]